MSDIFEFTKISDKAKSIGNEILKEVLDTRTYNANKISEWIDSINATIISRLKEMSPNFKYIVSSSIIQKVGAGIHLETSTYWVSIILTSSLRS